MTTTYNDRWDRVGFGAVILGGNLLAMGTLAFVSVPENNVQLIAQCVGALNASIGVIVAATWKTSVTERQSAEAVQTLANAVSAPLQTTTTTTTTKEPGDANTNGPTASPSEPPLGAGMVGELPSGGPGEWGGVAPAVPVSPTPAPANPPWTPSVGSPR